MKSFTLLILLALTVSGQEPKGKTLADLQATINGLKDAKNYTATYDRFDKQTIVNCDGIELTNGTSAVKLGVVFMFPGQTLTAVPTRIAIQIQSESSDWRFLRTQKISLLLDGEPLHLTASQSGHVRRGGVWELVLAPITFEQLEMLAGAKTVELRVGAYEFAFSAQHLNIFKAMYVMAWMPPA